LIRVSQRGFGPKPAAPKGKGGPPGPATVIPEKAGPTILERMVARGEDFPLGPPPALNKTWNAPRVSMLNKLEPHMDTFARKLREMYIREGTITQIKTYLNPIRHRLPSDTLEACMKEQSLPGVIHGRDEFSDLDFVWPWKTAFKVTKSDHAYVRPWYMIDPVTDEEIRVTCKGADYGIKTKLPYYIEFQRYIVGRPNLIHLPLVPAQEDKSLHHIAGANFNYHIRHVWVWCFNDVYPGRIDIDCSHLGPNMAIKIGDVEKMLPYGMYLHK
jgi:hypothetical protein